MTVSVSPEPTRRELLTSWGRHGLLIALGVFTGWLAMRRRDRCGQPAGTICQQCALQPGCRQARPMMKSSTTPT